MIMEEGIKGLDPMDSGTIAEFPKIYQQTRNNVKKSPIKA